MSTALSIITPASAVDVFAFNACMVQLIFGGETIQPTGTDMEQDNAKQVFFRPVTGTVLAVASGLSFFVLCMILPLVGPAGSRVEHAGKNAAAFIVVLMITLALAAASTWSKLGCRRSEGGPLPWLSLGLCVVCLLAFLVWVAGGFKI
jgi:hypothetical protein